MKNILILIISFISLSLYSQQVYPLNAYIEDVPRGSYFKDLDGELNPYIGLWKGNWNGKTVYLEFRKVKYYFGTTPSNGIYQDRILGERKIVEANGTVSIDRISNFNEQSAEFDGINYKFSNPSQKQLYFATGICGKTANIDINFVDTTKTQISLHLIYNPSYIDETCPYYNSVMQGNDYPINFPKDIILTKQ